MTEKHLDKAKPVLADEAQPEALNHARIAKSEAGPNPSLAQAQETVNKNLGGLEITDGRAKAGITAGTPPESEIKTPGTDARTPSDSTVVYPPAPVVAFDWKTRIANTMSDAVSAVEAHYTNPYGSSWNADWQDITSGAPLDRRVIDGFKAIYHGPRDLVENLQEGLNQQ